MGGVSGWLDTYCFYSRVTVSQSYLNTDNGSHKVHIELEVFTNNLPHSRPCQIAAHRTAQMVYKLDIRLSV
jgi:hypothetical protein